MSTDKSQVDELAGMVARGDLSDTAYLAVVERRATEWVDREILLRLDHGLTLRYREVAWLLFAIIGVVFLAALVVALS